MNGNDSSFMGAPIRSLQQMLRTVAADYPSIPFLTPDGYFGEATLEAVMVFQREFKLPVTGVVDWTTWQSLVTAFRGCSVIIPTTPPGQLFPGGDFCLCDGEEDQILFLIQGMFCALSEILDEVAFSDPCGKFEQSTHSNTCWLQRCCGREETGVFDQSSWDALCRLYLLFSSRSATDL